MNILALDPASKLTGWAHSDGTSGVWNLEEVSEPFESQIAARLTTLQKHLNVWQGCRLDIVVYETPFMGKQATAVLWGGRLQATIELWCYHSGVYCRGRSPSEIKKHACGKGNAKKLDMFKKAIKKWPDLDIIDDNHADALWLLDLATKAHAEAEAEA